MAPVLGQSMNCPNGSLTSIVQTPIFKRNDSDPGTGNNNMMRKITLTDIAREAGVSKQTVSRVINNNPDVARATRERVQVIIDRLGYQPNANARSLSARQSRIIGFIGSPIQDYGSRSALIAIDRGAQEAGYRFVPYFLYDNSPEEVESNLRALLAQQPDAVIWDVARTFHNKLNHILGEIQTDIPFLSVSPRTDGVPYVMEIPQAEAVSDLVNHLYDEGCRNIGVITGNMNWSAAEERLRGWRETLATHDLPAEPRQIAEGDWTPESGQEGTERLLTQFPEMDAILACNDQMALGALSALHARGIQVPQQIAVVGFDDVPEARFLTPSLTTIRQDFALYGTIQVNIALEMIQQQISTGEFHFPPPKYMRPQLVIRESSRHGIHINPS